MDSIPSYSEFRCGPATHAYNEAAFRHFLSVDRRRVERGRRSLLLVLVSLRDRPGVNLALPESTAAAVFSAFGDCVREIDYAGWFRAGTIAAAVLPQPQKTALDVRERTIARVMPALRKRLPPGQLENLRVRVIRLAR